MALMSLSALSLRAGRVAEARALVDSSIAASRTVTSPYVRVVRGSMALAAGEVDAAHDEADLALALDTVYSAPARSLLAMVYAAKGDRSRANQEIRKALADLPEGDVAPTEVRFIAVALVALGLKDQALSLIERARPRGATLWFYLTASASTRSGASPGSRRSSGRRIPPGSQFRPSRGGRVNPLVCLPVRYPLQGHSCSRCSCW